MTKRELELAKRHRDTLLEMRNAVDDALASGSTGIRYRSIFAPCPECKKDIDVPEFLEEAVELPESVEQSVLFAQREALSLALAEIDKAIVIAEAAPVSAMPAAMNSLAIPA